MRRMMSWLIVGALVALCAAPAQAQWKRRPLDNKTLDAQVEKAIRNCIDSLMKSQAGNGSWAAHGGYKVGPTALVTYSLLAAGVNPQDRRMVKALRFLAETETKKTYSLGLRCYVWHLANRSTLGKYRENLKKDAEVLIQWGLKNGSYGYGGPSGDNSNSQYGLLGVWAAAADGIEIPSEYWDKVLKHWMRSQAGSGGFDYRGPGNKATMTAAGVASLFVCYDYSGLADANPGKNFAPIQKGLGWWDKNFKAAGSGYLYYGIERVGLASGYKFFGTHDWYKEIATRLIGGGGKGRGAAVETAFALLFLIRGRRPVLFNKLQHSGDWDYRTRDMAAITRWVSYNFETEVNWQIISTKHRIDEWEDSSILYITGTTSPKFTDDEIKKIARFVRRGGMIFTVVQKGGTQFNKAMRLAYQKMFPYEQLTPVGKDHLLNHIYFTIKKPPKMSEVHNGARPLVVHCDEDLAKEWQSSRQVTDKNVREYEIAFNVVMYGVDKMSALPPRGAIHWPKDTVEGDAIKIAPVKHSGKWNPEPLAHRRFKGMMARYALKNVEFVEVVSLTGLPANGAKIAHMTGTGSVEFSAAEAEGLRKFVAGGGTLIVDAAGGDEMFGKQVEGLLARAFPGAAYQLGRLPTTSPIFLLEKNEIESCGFRRLTMMSLPSSEPQLDAVLVGDRPGVIYSRMDITTGLAGVRSGGVKGYDLDTAFDLMRNIVLHAAGATTTEDANLLKPAKDSQGDSGKDEGFGVAGDEEF